MTSTLLSPEIESPYVDTSRDDFVVSLVFGTPGAESADPREALARALLGWYLCPTAGDHVWCVWERRTGKRHLIEAKEALPVLPVLLRAITAWLDGRLSLPEGGSFRSLPWGDVALAIDDLELALRRGLEATEADFRRWQEHSAGDHRYGDEFSASEEQVAAMEQGWRLAYVARLLRSIALAYGMNIRSRSTGFGSVAVDDSGAVGAVVRHALALNPTE